MATKKTHYKSNKNKNEKSYKIYLLAATFTLNFRVSVFVCHSFTIIINIMLYVYRLLAQYWAIMRQDIKGKILMCSRRIITTSGVFVCVCLRTL